MIALVIGNNNYRHLPKLQTAVGDARTVGKVLAWMDANQGTNEDAAKYFLETYPDMWTKWVSPEVAEKVRAAL